jgi:hypothetical protein
LIWCSLFTCVAVTFAQMNGTLHFQPVFLPSFSSSRLTTSLLSCFLVFDCCLRPCFASIWVSSAGFTRGCHCRRSRSSRFVIFRWSVSDSCRHCWSFTSRGLPSCRLFLSRRFCCLIAESSLLDPLVFSLMVSVTPTESYFPTRRSSSFSLPPFSFDCCFLIGF